ncbi:hypothetical protein AB0F73_01425 [Micromonospora purpureochromogenes]|uniref:hypothetical protein n=1 Tax=Micromonospora purpureochromogenes TaxID=47872 RepID=UPI0033E5A6D5
MSDDDPTTPGAPPGSAAAACPPPTSPATTPSGTPAPPADRPTPLSATELPTLRPPSGLPKKPTDNRRTDVVAGRINRGGPGPCYGLVTDDGRQYALHGSGMGSFAAGTTVLVTIGPADPAHDCGPGDAATIVKIEPVG